MRDEELKLGVWDWTDLKDISGVEIIEVGKQSDVGGCGSWMVKGNCDSESG